MNQNATTQKLYVSSMGEFSKYGNTVMGQVIRTGWKLSRKQRYMKEKIIAALSDSDTNCVYERDGKIFQNFTNGVTVAI